MKKLFCLIFYLALLILIVRPEDTRSEDDTSHRTLRKIRKDRGWDHPQTSEQESCHRGESSRREQGKVDEDIRKKAKKNKPTFKIVKSQENQEGCKGGNCIADNYDI